MKTLRLNTWQYTVTALLLAGIILVSGTMLAMQTVTEIDDVFVSQDETNLRIMTERVNSYFEEMRRFCHYVQNHQILIEQLVTMNTSEKMYHKVQAHNFIRQYLGTFISNYENIDIIIIRSGDRVFRGGYTKATREIDETFERSDEITLHIPKTSTGLLLETPARVSDAVYYSFAIYDGDTHLADVCIVLDNRSIAELFSDRDDMLLLSGDQTPLVYQSEKWTVVRDLLGESSEGNPVSSFRSTLYDMPVSSEDLIVCYHHDRAEVRQALRETALYFLLSCAAAGLCFLMLSRLVHSQISSPIEALIRELNRVADTVRTHPHQLKEKFSLQNKLFFRLIMSVCIPSFCFLLVFTITTDQLIQDRYAYSNDISTEYLASEVDAILKQKSKSISHIAYDPNVYNLPSLDEDRLLTTKQQENLSELERVLRENTAFVLSDVRIELYYPNGTLFLSNEIRSLNLPSDYFAGNTPQEWYFEQDVVGQTQLCYYGSLLSIRAKGTLGYVKLSTPAHLIVYSIQQLNNRLESLQITNASNEILYQYTHTSGAVLSKLSRTQIGTENLFINARFRQEPLYPNLLLLYALFALFLLLFMYVLSFPLSKSLGRVSMAMSSLQLGDVDRVLEENFRIDEYNDIAAHFNRMTLQIEQLIDEILISNQSRQQIEMEKKTAEILALQAQINPHFLSNTIEMIIVTMQDGQILQAREMLHDLSKLFRYGISKTASEILVREEIAYAKAYANIMQKRYKAIDIQWDIDPSVMECTVTKLILQPILENAIYHGVRSMKRAGEIHVSCARNGDTIRVAVGDNGQGMTPERLEEVRSYLSDAINSERIGITNVNKRIKLTYGEQYGVTIDSVYGKGTLVTLTVPARRT